MKRKPLSILLPLVLGLASCVNMDLNPKKSSDPKSTIPPSDSQSGAHSESVPEESIPEGALGWSDEALDLMRLYLNGDFVPFFPMNEDWVVFYDDEYECFSATNTDVDFDYDGAVQSFIDMGYEASVQDLEDDERQLSFALIHEDYSSTYGYIYLMDGQLCYDAYHYDSVSEWPTEEIASITESFLGITTIIPEFEAPYYVLGMGYDMFGEYPYLSIDCYGLTDEELLTAEEDYLAIVTEALGAPEFEEDYGYYLLTDDGGELDFSLTDDGKGLEILLWGLPAEDEGSGDEEDPVIPTDPNRNEAEYTKTLSFANESHLTQKNATSSIWEYSPLTVKVDKDTSTIGVGNGSYFSDPFRFYAAQKMTISVSSEYVIDYVIFSTKSGKGTEGISGGTLTGCSVVSGATSTSITLNVSKLQSISIVASAQVQIESMTVGYSAK